MVSFLMEKIFKNYANVLLKVLEKVKKNDIMDNVKALCKRELKRKYFYSKEGAYYGRIKSEKYL